MNKKNNRLNLKKIYGSSISNLSAFESLSKVQMDINKLIKPSIFESVLKHQNQLDKLMDSTGFDALRKQQEKLSTLFNSPVLESLKKQQIQVSNVLSDSILKNMNNEKLKIQGLLSSPVFDSILKDQSRISKHLGSSIFNSINIGSNILSNLSNIKSITDSFKNKSTFQDALINIENSFTFNLIQEIEKENITLSETIDIVQESFSKKIEGSSQTLITFEGMVQILFAIILFIYSQVSTYESEKNITKKIDNLETNVMNMLAQLLPSNEMIIYYIVKRTVNLRSDYNMKSTIVSVLYPNQRVELIKRKSKWIYVKYFDHIDGVPKMGWVYKKYLKMEK